NIKEAVASLAANLLPIQKDPAARVQKQIESKRPGVADCLAAYLNISEKSKTGNSGSRYSSLSQTHAGRGDPQENKKEQALLQFDFHEISLRTTGAFGPSRTARAPNSKTGSY